MTLPPPVPEPGLGTLSFSWGMAVNSALTLVSSKVAMRTLHSLGLGTDSQPLQAVKMERSVGVLR